MQKPGNIQDSPRVHGKAAPHTALADAQPPRWWLPKPLPVVYKVDSATQISGMLDTAPSPARFSLPAAARSNQNGAMTGDSGR